MGKIQNFAIAVLFWVTLLTGCNSQVSSFVGGSSGGSSGGGTTTTNPPTPRIINNAYWTSGGGGTAGMSAAAYSISTTGVVNGDLLIMVGTVDNGSASNWPNPIAAGFTQLNQTYYGNDGQTVFVDWKIANNEPATYSGVYGPGIGSSAAAISLIAISGANASTVLNGTNSTFTFGAGGGVNPVTANTAGLTTTVNNSTLIHLSGADWQCFGFTSTTTLPASFLSLVSMGDRGATNTWDWSNLSVAYKTQATAGATGALNTSFTAPGCLSLGWVGLIAVAP
jgi:hypothetical protein